jgi:DNA-nicking Smr family endonuclease
MEKFKQWDDLRQVKRQLAEQHAAGVAQKAREAAEAQRLARQTHLFQNALGPVKPLNNPARAQLKAPPPQPVALQFEQDEQSALQESLSDEFEPSTLLEIDETLSFRRPGVGSDVTNRLRKGDWSIQAHLDLHGLRREEARDALGQFIRDSYKQGLRCLRVVHGKGLGSIGKAPVLKAKVQSWLIQKQEVIAFVQAKPLHGGAGALVVLLDAWQKRG